MTTEQMACVDEDARATTTRVPLSAQRVRVHDAQRYTELLDACDWSATLTRERRARQRAMRAAQAAEEAAQQSRRAALTSRARAAATAAQHSRRAYVRARREERELQRYRRHLDAFATRHAQLLSTWAALQTTARAHAARVRARIYALWHGEVFAPTQDEIDRKVAAKCGDGDGDNEATAAALWRARKAVLWRSFLDECNRRAAAPVRGAGVSLHTIDDVEYDPVAQCRAETIRYRARRLPAGAVDAQRREAHELQAQYTRLALSYRDAAQHARTRVLTTTTTTTQQGGSDAPVRCTRAADRDDNDDDDDEDDNDDDDDDDDDDNTTLLDVDTRDVVHALALAAPVYTVPLLPSAALQTSLPHTDDDHSGNKTVNDDNNNTTTTTTTTALPRVHIPYDFAATSSPRRRRRASDARHGDGGRHSSNVDNNDNNTDAATTTASAGGSRRHSRSVTRTATRTSVRDWVRERVHRGLSLTDGALYAERASLAEPLLVRDMQQRWSMEAQYGDAAVTTTTSAATRARDACQRAGAAGAMTTSATPQPRVDVDDVMPLPLGDGASSSSHTNSNDNNTNMTPAMQQMLPWLSPPSSSLSSRAKVLPREAFLPIAAWAARPLADTIYGHGVAPDGSVRESCARHKRDGAYMTHSHVVFDHYHFPRIAAPPHFGKRVY